MAADMHSGTDWVADLRDGFDRSFAEARSDAVVLADLLEIGVSTASYALRVTEISGVFADVKITPLPSPASELLGLAGVRGALVPVYDLRAMLGYAVDATPRWLAIAAATPVALAFDSFKRHIRVRPDTIVPHVAGGSVLRHVRDVVRLDNRTRPIVSVGSVLDAITNRVREAAPEKE